MKQEWHKKPLLIVPIGLFVVFLGLFVGTTGGKQAPGLPAEAAWFAVDTAPDNRGVSVHMLETSELANFFEQRLQAYDRDPLVRLRNMGNVAPIAPAPAPLGMQPRDGEGWHDRDARGGLFTTPGSNRERSGWGWLADDVHQIRGGSGAPATGGGVITPLPRRLDSDPGDTFHTRRWLAE